MRKLQFWISLGAFMMVILTCFTVSGAEDSQKININTASADELMQLIGIGEKKAALIIEFREKKGPFKLPEDLLKVPGIGIRTLEANKESIAVDPQ